MGGCRSTPPCWRTPAKVRRRQPSDEPNKTEVLLTVGGSRRQPNKTGCFVWFGRCGLRRPVAALRGGVASLRRGPVGRAAPASAGAGPSRPGLRRPFPLGRLGAVVGPSVPGASAPLRRALCNVGMNGISTQPLNPSAPISADTRPKQPCREGGCSSSILDKDKAGALVTLLLLSVPAPARSIRFCRTSPSKAGNSWRRSWSPPYRCDSGGAAHAHNCPQSAPTGPRRIFSSANGHPRSGAF